MAEQTTAEQTQPPTNPGPELEGADIRDNIDNLNDGFGYEPLFDDESVTDDSLKGDDTAEDTANAEPKVDEPEKKETEKPEQKKEPEKDPDKKEEPDKKDETPDEPEDKDKKDKTPPPGYVPQEALHQERQTTKTLKAEIQRLSAELEQATSKPVEQTEEFKEFKVLSDQEYADLQEEDPDEAARYLYKFNRYQQHLTETKERQMVEQRAAYARNAMIQEAVNEINTIIEGGPRGEYATKLVGFAKEAGMHPEWLQILTDPRTELKTADGKRLLMSTGAAQLVHVLKASFEKLSSVPDEAALRSQIEAELRPKIEEEIQTTLTKKLTSDPDSFRSIDQISSTGKKDTPSSFANLSEADVARLPEDQLQKYLGG